MSKYKNDDYQLFYAVGNADRLQQFMLEDWHDEAFAVWDPIMFGDDDASYIKAHQNEFDETLQLWADDLSCKTQKGYLEALMTDNGNTVLENIALGTYFNDLTFELRNKTGGLVDCGAYDGDSLRDYFSFAGDKGQKIWAFEPDSHNFEKLLLKFRNRENTEAICKGVWSKSARLHFSANSSEESAINEAGTEYIDVTSIDEVVKDQCVAAIKMDVEGSELEALKGAEKTILRDYPMLMISAYHKVDDLIALPQWIASIDKEKRYNLYLRHHACVRAELVLYAIPKW